MEQRAVRQRCGKQSSRRAPSTQACRRAVGVEHARGLRGLRRAQRRDADGHRIEQAAARLFHDIARAACARRRSPQIARARRRP
jgi:hypothetical protein